MHEHFDFCEKYEDLFFRDVSRERVLCLQSDSKVFLLSREDYFIIVVNELRPKVLPI